MVDKIGGFNPASQDIQRIQPQRVVEQKDQSDDSGSESQQSAQDPDKGKAVDIQA